MPAPYPMNPMGHPDGGAAEAVLLAVQPPDSFTYEGEPTASTSVVSSGAELIGGPEGIGAIGAGNAFFIRNGGIASNCFANTQGKMFVEAGGKAIDVSAVTGGGYIRVLYGGVGSRVTVAGGTLTVLAGGVVYSGALRDGDMGDTSAVIHGRAREIVVYGGTMTVSGGRIEEPVLSGGAIVIESYGYASGAVLSGGLLTISAGASSVDTLVLTGGTIDPKPGSYVTYKK